MNWEKSMKKMAIIPKPSCSKQNSISSLKMKPKNTSQIWGKLKKRNFWASNKPKSSNSKSSIRHGTSTWTTMSMLRLSLLSGSRKSISRRFRKWNRKLGLNLTSSSSGQENFLISGSRRRFFSVSRTIKKLKIFESKEINWSNKSFSRVRIWSNKSYRGLINSLDKNTSWP